MRILFLGPIPPFPGGAAILNSQLLEGLAALGHEVRALSPVTERTRAAARAYGRLHPNIAVRRTHQARYAVGGYVPDDGGLASESRQIAEALGVELTRHRPDVAVFGREPFVACAYELLQQANVPYLAIVHGSIARAAANGELEQPVREVVERFLRGSAHAVAVAENGLDVADRLGVARCSVIRNVVDADVFKPAPPEANWRRRLGVAETDVVVTHVSNLKPVKRPLDLVAAARIAISEDPRLLFLIVGDGPLRREMEHACASLGLSARFRFTGWLDRAAIPSILNLSAIVAMPSEAESRSLACLEAQACGRVLIASDIPAAREIVENGVNGLLFETGSSAALARQILRAAADAGLRSRIGRMARERAERDTIRGFVEAYQRLIVAEACRATSPRAKRTRVDTPRSRASTAGHHQLSGI